MYERFGQHAAMTCVWLIDINNFVLDFKASQLIFLAGLPKLPCVFKEKEVWQYFTALSVFGTTCNPIHSTDSQSPLKVQGCPIVAFAEFKVITVVMTGILFCLRPPCSAPASAAPRILQVGICPRFFVVLVLQSARRSALQCANCRARQGRVV